MLPLLINLTEPGATPKLMTVCGQQTTASQPQEYYDIPVNIEAPVRPIPVKGVDGKWYLVYHLFMTNLGFSGLMLKSVEVSDAGRGILLTRYADKELAEYYRFRTLLPTPPRAEMPDRQYPRAIASGRTGVLFFWLTVDSPGAVPTSLKHRFVFEPNPLIKLLRDFTSDQGGEMVLDDYDVPVGGEKPVVSGDLNGNEGLPFVFDSLVIDGRQRRMEMPVNNTVMRFR